MCSVAKIIRLGLVVALLFIAFASCMAQPSPTSEELWLEPDYLDSVEADEVAKVMKMAKRDLASRASTYRRPIYELIINLLDNLASSVQTDTRRKRERQNGVVQII